MLNPLLLKALGKDKILATSLAIFNQVKPLPIFQQTVDYWKAHGQSLLTFPVVRGRVPSATCLLVRRAQYGGRVS